jgi:hypothetical protein
LGLRSARWMGYSPRNREGCFCLGWVLYWTCLVHRRLGVVLRKRDVLGRGEMGIGLRYNLDVRFAHHHPLRPRSSFPLCPLCGVSTVGAVMIRAILVAVVLSCLVVSEAVAGYVDGNQLFSDCEARRTRAAEFPALRLIALTGYTHCSRRFRQNKNYACPRWASLARHWSSYAGEPEKPPTLL